MQRYMVLAIFVAALSMVGLFLFGANVRAQVNEPGVADQKEDQDEARTAEALDTTFTYNGFLEASGVPINDSCDFTVALKNDESATLQTINVNNVPVAEGYFTADLTFSAIYLDGRELALDFTVDCDNIGTDIVFSSTITAVPYAHTLRPGAEISGDDSIAILQIENSGVGDGIRINDATDDGIQITNAGYGINILNVSAIGVDVVSSGEHGVRANSTGADQYGGYFINSANSATDGYGVYARSNKGSSADLVLGANSSALADGAGIIRSDSAYLFTDMRLESADEIELHIGLDYDEVGFGSSHVTVFYGAGTKIFELDGAGNLSIAGSLTEGGVRRVADPDTSYREFEYGSVALVDGLATVFLSEGLHAEVNGADYQVVLTPVGGYCPLYVAEKENTQFTIAADNGADCTISVDYQIAVEVTHTSERIEEVEE